ncbi:MAG: acyl-CoA dehydrogenase [Jatrophihabitantaceae bacterium]
MVDDDDRPAWAEDLLAAARAAGEDAAAALRLAADYGVQLPLPGQGRTATRWRLLAEVSACDLTAGRILEAHSDALAILAEAGADENGTGADRRHSTWGVFAAEAPGARLDAESDGAGHVLRGTKPWCSLGERLDRALVTAHAGEQRQLFAVDLHHPSVRAEPPSGWVARGLRNVPSGPVHFDATPARAVGARGWYLTRPGFAWGGMGVAACWYGAAQALGRALRPALARREGELAALHAGIVDVALHAAACVLASAAGEIDSGQARGAAGELLALRVRAVVADTAEQVLAQVGHALGPAPLAFDEEHARRVADLQLYVRQHHAERDLATLGSAVLHDGQPVSELASEPMGTATSSRPTKEAE